MGNQLRHWAHHERKRFERGERADGRPPCHKPLRCHVGMGMPPFVPASATELATLMLKLGDAGYMTKHGVVVYETYGRQRYVQEDDYGDMLAAVNRLRTRLGTGVTPTQLQSQLNEKHRPNRVQRRLYVGEDKDVWGCMGDRYEAAHRGRVCDNGRAPMAGTADFGENTAEGNNEAMGPVVALRKCRLQCQAIDTHEWIFQVTGKRGGFQRCDEGEFMKEVFPMYCLRHHEHY